VQEQTAATAEPGTDSLSTHDDLATDHPDPDGPEPAGPDPDGVDARDEGAGGGGRARWRVIAGRVVTTLAVLFVLFAVLMPNQMRPHARWMFIRLPVEPLVAVVLLLALRQRIRPWAAGILGAGLGLLVIVKTTDIGFYAALDRPFDLVLDWGLLDDAMAFLEDSVGRAGAIATVAGIGVLAAGLVVLTTLSALRIDRLVAAHSTAAIRTVLALGVVWVVLATFGVQFQDAVPVATQNSADLLKDRALQARHSLRDKQVFAKQARVDAFRNTPGDQLLTALRGKDVVISFVESYGRSAIEDPRLAPVVDPVLDAGTRELKEAGFASRSAFLTSPTAGGGSWLAHSTLLSGLWIDSQQRYRTLLASDRLSLVRCFDRAGWRTASFEPNTTRGFPEAKSFYGYEQVYTYEDFGYRGPRFSWSRMPDQYTMETFQQREYGKPGRGPLLGEITLTSSHSPWTPLPEMVDWNALGDGTVFGPIEAAGYSATRVWKNARLVRAGYAQSVAYSVQSLVSYVTKYGKDNLVLILLGDHQPAPVVTGNGASRDVPITIVARDPAVLDRIAGWQWEDGLNPSPKAPVLRMDKFRDRFLTAFGPKGTPAAPPPASPSPSAPASVAPARR
jgi:hypothetical protein